MNRRAIAIRLSLLVALAGLLPIGVVGIAALQMLRQRAIDDARSALAAVAAQAAARLGAYLDAQIQMLRAVASVASGPEAERKLSEVTLDVPSLRDVTVVTEGAAVPPRIDPALVRQALAGQRATTAMYLSADTTPLIDVCIPTASRQRVACGRIDLLEVWRFVQRIHVGKSGYALAFERDGKLLASGLGSLRGAILTGDPITESAFARAAPGHISSAPRRYARPDGTIVLAGWAEVPKPGWTVSVEEPLDEALEAMRVAEWAIGSVLVVALFASLSVGFFQSQRVLRELEIEERWRTAGRIAAGITHDLGHRLRVLQQTAALADAQNPAFAGQIAENLRSEVATLRRFVADFSDLSRDVRSLRLLPLELGAFVESIRRSAQPHADAQSVLLQVMPPPAPIWARADRHLLERAALNLVSNAIEASPRGKTVTLTARSNGNATIEVIDEGPGISLDRQENLFEAFLSTKKTGAHLGMGLANVKRIIDAHGGRVFVSSKPGEGARFRFELPAQPPP